MIPERFVFGKQNKNGGCLVTCDGLFSEIKGYGFVTQRNMYKDETLTDPDLCNNFTVPTFLRSETVTKILDNDRGCYIDQNEMRKRLSAEDGRLVPLYFRAKVPRYGNYRITLTLYGEGEALVFAATRRLVFKGTLKKDVPNVVSFVHNVCEIIPRGKTTIHERMTIGVSILGEDVTLSEMTVRQVNCQTLYICGDSTVTDQSADMPYAPGTSYSGWGQMLSVHMSDEIAISNHAHSGLTTESFRNEGHYSIVQAHIRPGDYIMFQFAHNDQKLAHLKAREGYTEKLAAYIKEAGKSGAYPIIVTPLARNTWKADGEYNDLLKEYAEACIELGARSNVPVIDLHGFSMGEVVRLGLESAKRYYFPKDYTHTNDFGAYKMAGFIADSLLAFKNESTVNPYARLGSFVIKNETKWDTDTVPVLPEIPERFKDKKDPAADNDLFKDIDRPSDPIKRAEMLDFAIKTARFFPTNVFNDLYDDIVGHEWYAGAVQTAYQNGLIPAKMVKDGKLKPEDDATLEDVLCFLMSAYKARKALPKVTETVKPLHEYAADYVNSAVAVGLIDKNEDLNSTVTRRRAADLCIAADI